MKTVELPVTTLVEGNGLFYIKVLQDRLCPIKYLFCFNDLIFIAFLDLSIEYYKYIINSYILLTSVLD